MDRKIAIRLILLVTMLFTAITLPFYQVAPVFAATETLTVDGDGADTSGTWTPSGWLAGWTYQKVFQIRHTDDGAQTNYQMPLHIDFGAGVDGEETINGVVGGVVYVNGLSQADFDDIRVTTSDGTTLLDIWLEEKTDGVEAYFWIEFDTIPVSPTDAWFCLYYGNAGAASVSSGADTFIFFDDFERGVNGDAVGGSWTVDTAVVEISTDTAYTGTRSGKWVGGTSPLAKINQAASNDIALYYRIYKETAVTDCVLRHGNGVNGLRLNADNDEIYEWYDGALYNDTNPNVVLNPDAWDYTNVWDFDFTTNDAVVDNASNTADITFYASASYTNQFAFLGDPVAGRDIYLDNFIIRNWTENTPRFGTWSEQATDPTQWEYLNSDDGDGTYLSVAGTATTPLRHSVSFSAATANTISSITMYYKVEYGSAGNDAVKSYSTIGGTRYYQDTYVASNTFYTLYSSTWTSSPATGDTWTAATINAATFGLEFQGTYSWTYCYMVVTYSTAAFAAIITDTATNAGLTTITMNGEVTDYGTSTITERGFVWDTTSHPINPGNVDHTLTDYAQNWADAPVSMTTGTFSYSAAVLVANTQYYYRAFVYNSAGWVYGDEVPFRTVGTATVTLLDETNVSTATAQLNAVVTYDGEQPCDMRFGWDTVTQAANADLYTNHSDWVNDAYATGSNPYYVITGLAAATNYFFNIQIRNDYGTVQGVELDFTTPAAGLSAPTNFTAKPESNAMNLAWTKDPDASGVIIRYSIATYPTATTEGSLAYQGTSGSHRLTGLTSGFTYYFSAWCYADGTTSATYAEVLGTTWAYNYQEDETPVGTVSKWFTESTSANLQKIPGHQLVTSWASTYSMPETTVWFILGMIMSVAIGAVVYSFSSNTNIAVMAVAVSMFGGVMAGLYAGWMIFVVIILSAGMIFVAARH